MSTLASLILLASASIFAQTDSNQTIQLRHKPREVGYYSVDGLMLRIEQPGGIVVWSFGNQTGDMKVVPLILQESFKFDEADIVECKARKDIVFIQTKVVIVLDSLVLEKKADKKKYLRKVMQSTILSIERLEVEEAITLYGELGKKGIVRIRTH